MKKVMIIVLALILGYIIIQMIYSGFYFRRAAVLTKTEFTQDVKLGDKEKPPLKVFMSGDSIASGVGASSFETSTAGRLADFIALNRNVIFVNEAYSGTRMADLLKKPAPKEKQDLIVLIISSNDLFHFTNLNKFEEATREVLKKYSKLTDRLILLGPGKVSTAPALPLPVRFIYTLQEPKYVAIISTLASKYKNITYIKPGTPAQGTFAADKFHPNDAGHKVWFEAIKDVIR